jgi:hypothetical protein
MKGNWNLEEQIIKVRKAFQGGREGFRTYVHRLGVSGLVGCPLWPPDVVRDACPTNPGQPA